MMNDQLRNHTPAERRLTRAERLLAAVGIESTPVARCPVTDCPVCAPRELQAAA